MNSVAKYLISRSDSHRIDVHLDGSLERDVLMELETELRVHLASAPAGRLQVCIDLRRVDEYSLEARDVLIRIQRYVAGRAAATLYFASGPAMRALALWAIRMSGDRNAHAVAGPHQADPWLEVSEVRSRVSPSAADDDPVEPAVG